LPERDPAEESGGLSLACPSRGECVPRQLLLPVRVIAEEVHQSNYIAFGYGVICAHDPSTFAMYEPQFEEVMLRLLSDQAEQMVIVPSDQLYIEALPGAHPILEDFKLIHRALDVKKVQAEVRHAELENLRLAARLANGELGDPDVDKVVVVGKSQQVTVDAAQ
jgi:hypothetical protein